MIDFWIIDGVRMPCLQASQKTLKAAAAAADAQDQMVWCVVADVLFKASKEDKLAAAHPVLA